MIAGEMNPPSPRCPRENDLLSLINKNSFPHALIVEGGDAEQRLRLAADLSAALCCGGGTRPCGVCSSCRKADADIHPDIRRIASEKLLGIDLIRDSLIRDISLKPGESERKVYIVDLVNGITDQAQNALLKSLEEPPKNVYIILLCSDRLCLIETVRSRCIVFGLEAGKVANSSQGAVLADGFARSLVSDNPLDSFVYATGLPRAARGELGAVLDALAAILSGALRVKVTNGAGDDAAQMLAGFRIQSLASCAEMVNKYRNMLPQNLNPDSVVSGLAVELWEELH